MFSASVRPILYLAQVRAAPLTILRFFEDANEYWIVPERGRARRVPDAAGSFQIRSDFVAERMLHAEVEMLRIGLCVIGTMVAVSTGVAVEWYEQMPMTSRDPFVLATYLYDNVLQTHYDVRPGTSVASGHVYVQLTKADYDSVYGRRDRRMVRATGTPTAQNLTFIRNTLQSRATVSVPYFLQALAGIPPIPPTVGLTFTLMDFVANQPNSPKVSANNILPLLASGGQFDEVVVAAKDASGHEFWSTSAVYRVQVGSETRNCVFYSGTYAVRVIP